MAQVGIVKTLEGGVFYAKDSSGNIRELSIGDSISENEVVYGDSSNQISAKVEMELSGNDIIVLNQAQQQLIDSSLNQVTFGNEEVIFTKGDINATFENADLSAWNNTTNDVSDDMETAAGDPTQQETQAGEEEPTEEGRVAARFSTRDGSSTNVVSDLRELADFGTQSETGNGADEIPAELRNLQNTTTEPTTPTEPIDTRVEASKITLSNPTIEEGKDITIIATVDNAPQTDLIITLNNGEKITIKAGETSGSITFTNPNTEDVYLDNSTETYTIVGTDGGNYVSLDTSDSSVVTITDTIDEVKVWVSADGNVKENETGNFKVNVSQALDHDIKVTLSDGSIVTITAGTTSTDIPVSAQGDDVWEDGETKELGATSVEVVANAGETTAPTFENLNVDSTKATIEITDTTPPTVTITGSTVSESNTGTVTGNKTIGTVTISFNKPLTEDLTITLNNGQKIDFKVGDTTKTVEVETSRVDDAYKQGTTTETVSIASTSNSKIDVTDKTATITIKDDSDPIDVTVTAVVTTPKIIDVNTKTDGTTGVNIKAYGSDGKETKLTTITGTNHDGFGVETKVNGKSVNNSNGDTKELGVGEKIVVEFTDKDVNSLDVSFAWRNNHETAKLTFINDGKIVGYATVTGDGSSTTKAIVTYYDENGEILKVVNAKGSSDKVDELFTFELPDSNGGIVSFDTVEFSAPKTVDDYLINSIVYKEVINTSITDVLTDGGKVTFNIQVDENYPPQGKATAIVEVNGKEYEVSLNATGRGTLELSSSDLGTDLSNVEVKVVRIEGGNYESVNSTTAEFDFTTSGTGDNLSSSNDNINTYEDTAYILKVTDFGEYGEKVQEFKITELPTNGKLYLTVTKGETIIDKDGNKTIATEDTKVEISKNQIVTLADVGAGRVVFEPTANSDADGQFKFQVGDGKGHFSSEYTTTIDVKAVADAPVVTINIEKVGETTGNEINNNGTTGNNNGSTSGGIETGDFWKGYNTREDIIKTATYEKNEVNWSNNNGFTSGDDSVSVGTLNASINTGNGNDNIYVSGNVNQSISAGAGDDKIFIKGSAGQSWTIDLGEGNNHLHVKGDVGLVTGHSGNDTVLIEGSSTNTINLGDGNNELHIKGSAKNTINTGLGDDKVLIEGNSENSINLGAGNNELYINGTSKNTIDTGSGNDKVVIAGNANNDIRLGSGNDYLRVSGLVIGNLYGGEGVDTLQLDSYSKDDYGTSILPKWKINGFESIIFKDGTYEVNSDGTLGDKVEPEVTVYNYNITVNAQLTDTDGSENLSDVTLKNIPEGSKLFGADGKEIDANDNGTYTVKVDENGEAKLSLTNENEVSDTDLNSIKASATSTENSNQDSATSTVDNILSTDINLDNLSSIISENGEINLANSKAENISLTLDDVLKISGDDNTIKISGDKFDSVTFKDTIGDDGKENAWSKTEGTGADKGYDIYMNSGDPTVQVKVEQPISDGITN